MKIYSTLFLALAGTVSLSAANPTIAETKIGYTQIKTNIMKAAEKMPAEAYSYLSSRLVRELARLGGEVKGLVPPIVEERLRAKVG